MQSNDFQGWKLGLSYEKALQTFATFCESLRGVAIATLVRDTFICMIV